MIAIFKQKTPGNILVLLVFGILLKLPMFTDPHVPVIKPENGSLFNWFLGLLNNNSNTGQMTYPIIAFGFLFLQAIMLTRFINEQRMTSKATYFPGMAYMLITSLFPEWNYLSAPLIINTILVFILSGLFKIHHQENAKGTIYNIGLAMGFAAFIFFPSVTFIFWILMAMLVMRPFRINEWVICIVGLLTPFYFYGVYLFITDQWSWANLLPEFVIGFPVVEQSAWLAGSVFLIIIPFLSGGYHTQDNLRRMLIQVRKGWSLILLYLLGAVFIPFVNNSDSFENWVMAAIPFAAFHASAYLYTSMRWFSTLLFWVTVLFIIAYQYAGPGW
ncbi:MAG TPA: DUF6427 family protein [Chitinophagaceae bacterium]|nr:DUF6427 family protein [Chitinophagaceae bacterium]